MYDSRVIDKHENNWRRLLNLLAEIATKFHGSDSPQEIVDNLCRKVMQILDCQVYFNYLVDEEQGRLHLNAYAGIPEEEGRRIEWLDFVVAVRGCDKCDACRIVAQNKPATPVLLADLLKTYGIKGYACLPLMVRGRVLGTLSFGTRNSAELSDDVLAMLKAVADHVAIAIERKQVDEELRRAKELAKVATRTKSQFLDNMSHELRTPMTGVLGMLDLALAGNLETEQREFIEIAQTSCRSLVRILNDILDVTRIRKGKFLIQEEPFTVRSCVENTFNILLPIAKSKGLEFNFMVADNVPETLLGDQTRLNQILTNLAANAVKFTENGKVELLVIAGASESGGKRGFTFSVADTGIGIPDDKKELLFQVFSQVDNSNTRRYGGSGLGLAICKEIVEHMGGTIGFTSEEGQGSVFTFSIPFAEAEPQRISISDARNTTTAKEASPPDKTIKARLLVAEDDPTTRQVLGSMLKLARHEVSFAENGQKVSRCGKMVNST